MKTIKLQQCREFPGIVSFWGKLHKRQEMFLANVTKIKKFSLFLFQIVIFIVINNDRDI